MASADETRARERRDRWMRAYCAALGSPRLDDRRQPGEVADAALAAFDTRFPAGTTVWVTADGPVPCSGLFEGLSDANPA